MTRTSSGGGMTFGLIAGRRRSTCNPNLLKLSAGTITANAITLGLSMTTLLNYSRSVKQPITMPPTCHMTASGSSFPSPSVCIWTTTRLSPRKGWYSGIDCNQLWHVVPGRLRAIPRPSYRLSFSHTMSCRTGSSILRFWYHLLTSPSVLVGSLKLERGLPCLTAELAYIMVV